MIAGIYLVFTAAFGFWLGSIVDHNSKRISMMDRALSRSCSMRQRLACCWPNPRARFTDPFGPYLWVFVLLVMLGVIAGNIRSIALPTLVTIMIPEDERDRRTGW